MIASRVILSITSRGRVRRRFENQGKFGGANLWPAGSSGAGLHSPDDFCAAQLGAVDSIRLWHGLRWNPGRLVSRRTGVLSGAGGEGRPGRSGVADADAGGAAEERRGFSHRVERGHAVGPEPVVPGHGMRVQRAQPVFAFAHRGGGDGVGVGVSGHEIDRRDHVAGHGQACQQPPVGQRQPQRPATAGGAMTSAWGVRVLRVSALLVACCRSRARCRGRRSAGCWYPPRARSGRRRGPCCAR